MKSAALCVLLSLTCLPAIGQTKPKSTAKPPLLIGWHDEMNATEQWKPIPAEFHPDVYAEHPGALTLRLPHVPEGYPYDYQWNAVSRSISADLAHYPILVADVSHLDPGSYAHLDVEERDFSGHVVHSWRSSTLTQPGLTSIDMGKALDASVRRLTVRLIVGGKLEGAKCEYRWVRFVRREDFAYLQEVPNCLVASREPQGDSPQHPARDAAQR